MTNRYDILEFLSQRENGEMPKENEIMVSLINNIRRATSDSQKNENESGEGISDVTELNELEKRYTEQWAKAHNCWGACDPK